MTSSPDMFAPDMIPVTPEKRTPKMVKKLRGTESSHCEQSKANLRDYITWSGKEYTLMRTCRLES